MGGSGLYNGGSRSRCAREDQVFLMERDGTAGAYHGAGGQTRVAGGPREEALSTMRPPLVLVEPRRQQRCDAARHDHDCTAVIDCARPHPHPHPHPHRKSSLFVPGHLALLHRDQTCSSPAHDATLRRPTAMTMSRQPWLCATHGVTRRRQPLLPHSYLAATRVWRLHPRTVELSNLCRRPHATHGDEKAPARRARTAVRRLRARTRPKRRRLQHCAT